MLLFKSGAIHGHPSFLSFHGLRLVDTTYLDRRFCAVKLRLIHFAIGCENSSRLSRDMGECQSVFQPHSSIQHGFGLQRGRQHRDANKQHIPDQHKAGQTAQYLGEGEHDMNFLKKSDA
jgi:hypothetical protein